MGNYFSAVIRGPPYTAGKVILWDGSIQEFSWPLTAAELMLEHPQQVVAEFYEAFNGKRPVPLPADEKLDVKKDLPCESYARDGTKILVAIKGNRPSKGRGSRLFDGIITGRYGRLAGIFEPAIFRQGMESKLGYYKGEIFLRERYPIVLLEL
ncbi:histidine kinase CKI1-like isoform X1 [Hibiscus syriacus]|uniref:Histidine kinase CKI1-like isoform X1 n=1 Tax=Hibiscus syriacus TaxID=106335 RepID=A0A6A2XMJ7_HIBSY|nr:histidine kinase CKI1-like isoform X1 [Hibiscus syriacus]